MAIVHVLFLFAWIIAGQQCRKYKEPLSRAPLWAVCLGAAAVALVAAYFSNGGTSYMLATGIFPNGYMLTMVATGAGIVLLLRLCLCAADLPIKPEKSSLLSERMARNSYSIMCHHIFGFFVLDAVFLDDFNVYAFLSELRRRAMALNSLVYVLPSRNNSVWSRICCVRHSFFFRNTCSVGAYTAQNERMAKGCAPFLIFPKRFIRYVRV